MTTRLKDPTEIKEGDRVVILSENGYDRHLGTVQTAQNWGSQTSPDWFIELIDDQSGYVYWKQQPDGKNETVQLVLPTRPYSAWVKMTEKVQTISALPNVSLSMLAFFNQYQLTIPQSGLRNPARTLDEAKANALSYLVDVEHLFVDESEIYLVLRLGEISKDSSGDRWRDMFIEPVRLGESWNSDNPFDLDGKWTVKWLSDSDHHSMSYDLYGFQLSGFVSSDMDRVYGYSGGGDYKRSGSIDLDVAKRMLKVLEHSKTEHRRWREAHNYDYPETFADMAGIFAKTVGAVGVIIYHDDVPEVRKGYFTYRCWTRHPLNTLHENIQALVDQANASVGRRMVES